MHSDHRQTNATTHKNTTRLLAFLDSPHGIGLLVIIHSNTAIPPKPPVALVLEAQLEH